MATDSQTLETDYLIIGAGAMGMAFADTVFNEQPDAKMIIVDRRAKPGGHWVDAYPYVALHQPAAFTASIQRRSGRAGKISPPGPRSTPITFYS